MMKQKIPHHTLKTVAEKHHMSEDQLRRELDALIADTLSEISRTGNVHALAAWQAIPKEGSVPTADEFIQYLARQFRNHGS